MAVCNICKIGRVSNKGSYKGDFDDIEIKECSKCGIFHIEQILYHDLDSQGASHTLSSLIRENSDSRPIRILFQDELDSFLSTPDKTLDTKYELFLKQVMKDFVIEDEEIHMDSEDNVDLYLAVSWCKDTGELKALIREAVKRGDIITSDDGIIIKEITFHGRMNAQSINQDSNKIFMAFHFTDEMKDQFESTIRRAVTDASENKLEAVRVSSSTTDHDTKIDDELIGMLKSSKAVIADFTGQRNAVYYEAGYAMGLGIHVIWTCRDTDADALSFDTRQYPHIIWKDEDDLYKQVVNRLKAKIL